MKLAFDLPVQPTDGHEVHWWEVDVIWGPRQRRARYYVNTSWADYSPDERDRGGAPLVDCWMLSRQENGAWYAEGRMSGWTAVNGMSHEASAKFHTRGEALVYWRGRLEQRLQAVRRELAQCEGLIDGVNADIRTEAARGQA